MFSSPSLFVGLAIPKSTKCMPARINDDVVRLMYGESPHADARAYQLLPVGVHVLVFRVQIPAIQ